MKGRVGEGEKGRQEVRSEERGERKCLVLK